MKSERVQLCGWAGVRRLALFFLGLGLAGCAHSPPPERNPIAARLQIAEAWQNRLHSTGLSPEELRIAQSEFDRATAATVAELKERTSISTWSALTNGGLVVGPYLLRILTDPHADPSRQFPQFDRFYPADLKAEKGAGRRCIRTGSGATLVGEQSQAPSLERSRTNFFSHRLYLPVTALLRFPEADGGRYRPAELSLIDPRSNPTAVIDGTNVPVAANFAAPTRMSLAREAFIKSAWLGLIWPGLHLEETGLYLLEPYNPEKIPVVLVHGLYSSPATWFELAGAISADPELSARFQIWYFIYPTGLPVPGSAMRLRRAMRELFERVDPGLNHPSSRQIVLIGHSMGGLLSRLQATPSGDAFWTNYFSKPINELILSDSVRRTLERSFYFEPQPCVSRLICIATPHRGSELADFWLSRMFVRFIELPAATLKTTTELLTLNVDAIRPDLLEYRNLSSTSVESLSPRNPLFKAMSAQPIQVPVHSIVANRSRDTTKPTSDGVVPYWSAHLTNSQSEIIIPAGHACTDHVLAIAEVGRILRVHWNELHPNSTSSSPRGNP